MKISFLKTVSVLWIFTLIISSQICLLDYPLNFVTGLTHNHNASKNHEHKKHDGSDHQGDEQNTAGLCCKDFRNLYLRNTELDNSKLTQEFISDIILPIEFPVSCSLQPTSYSYEPTTIILSRLRDKYALSCLLHAPPRA